MPVFNTPGGNSEVREPLHPVVQLRLGADDFLTTVPPENLQEFTFESKPGLDKASITLVDSTFGGLERRLFEQEKLARPILLRWGYPGQGLENTEWQKLELQTYQPTLSYAGLIMNIEFLTKGSEFAHFVEPRVYVGKISSVVRQIAEEMGYASDVVFIEETDDDMNEERKQQWASTHLTRIEMIHSMMAHCNSKTNPSIPYSFKLSAAGSFHFHTSQFLTGDLVLAGAADFKQKIREFHVLFGVPNGVVNFTPRYEGRNLGPYVRSVLAQTLDPRSKQFQQRVLSRETLGMVEKELTVAERATAKTTAVDFKKEADDVSQRSKTNGHAFMPTQHVALGGRCSGKTTTQYTEPSAAFASVETAYKNMHQQVQGADLELVGLPEHASFVAEELHCKVLVILPDEQASLAGGRTWEGKTLHWSSGKYLIKVVRHTISSGYTINAELQRSFGLVGTDSLKVSSPERKAAPATLRTT